jgi:hypothetical protein
VREAAEEDHKTAEKVLQERNQASFCSLLSIFVTLLYVQALAERDMLAAENKRLEYRILHLVRSLCAEEEENAKLRARLTSQCSS